MALPLLLIAGAAAAGVWAFAQRHNARLYNKPSNADLYEGVYKGYEWKIDHTGMIDAHSKFYWQVESLNGEATPGDNYESGHASTRPIAFQKLKAYIDGVRAKA